MIRQVCENDNRHIAGPLVTQAFHNTTDATIRKSQIGVRAWLARNYFIPKEASPRGSDGQTLVFRVTGCHTLTGVRPEMRRKLNISQSKLPKSLKNQDVEISNCSLRMGSQDEHAQAQHWLKHLQAQLMHAKH